MHIVYGCERRDGSSYALEYYVACRLVEPCLSCVLLLVLARGPGQRVRVRYEQAKIAIVFDWGHR